MPEDVSMVTLTWAYMSMMTWYTDNEIYSSYQWISNESIESKALEKMRHNKSVLCKNLSLLPKKVFVYVGSREYFTSTLDNPCLKEVKKWNNNARLLYYKGHE
jgi:hypothetical protein